MFKLKNLLEKTLVQLTKASAAQKSNEDLSRPNSGRKVKAVDLPMIHEAYQFLLKNYVDSDMESSLFLTPDQLCVKFSDSSRRSSRSSQGGNSSDQNISGASSGQESDDESGSESEDLNQDAEHQLIAESEELMNILLDVPALSRTKHIRKDRYAIALACPF